MAITATRTISPPLRSLTPSPPALLLWNAQSGNHYTRILDFPCLPLGLEICPTRIAQSRTPEILQRFCSEMGIHGDITVIQWKAKKKYSTQRLTLTTYTTLMVLFRKRLEALDALFDFRAFRTVMSNWWPAGQKWPSKVPKMARKGLPVFPGISLLTD